MSNISAAFWLSYCQFETALVLVGNTILMCLTVVILKNVALPSHKWCGLCFIRPAREGDGGISSSSSGCSSSCIGPCVSNVRLCKILRRQRSLPDSPVTWCTALRNVLIESHGCTLWLIFSACDKQEEAGGSSNCVLLCAARYRHCSLYFTFCHFCYSLEIWMVLGSYAWHTLQTLCFENSRFWNFVFSNWSRYTTDTLFRKLTFLKLCFSN